MNDTISQSSNTDETKQSTASVISKVLNPIISLFNKILPPYEPRIDIDKRKISGETISDHAVIRHFSEVQLVLGLIAFIAGFIVRGLVGSGYAWFITILGIVLFFSAYEMEEIYVTSHRIIIRRVGMVERIMKVPSDEDHAINHLVSFQVGRAPVNIFLVVIAGIGYLVIFSNNQSDFFQLLVIISATIILYFGLRVNRRAVTLHLAGGLNVIMGLRKGIPKRIISAIQVTIYEDQPTQPRHKPSGLEMEQDKPAK